MAIFIHFTPETSRASIRRSGLRPGRGMRGIYAVPATPNFYASHQWLRELKRCHQRNSLLAVYFRVEGDRPALFGPYGGPHAIGTADMAVAALMHAEDPLGFETILAGRVSTSQITRIARINPSTGWRFFPKAKGRKPCSCPMCLGPGEPYSQKIRARFPFE